MERIAKEVAMREFSGTKKRKPTTYRTYVVKGHYPPTTVRVQKDEESGTYYVHMHGMIWVYASTPAPKFEDNERLNFRFSQDGARAWAHKNQNFWAGVFEGFPVEAK